MNDTVTSSSHPTSTMSSCSISNNNNNNPSLLLQKQPQPNELKQQLNQLHQTTTTTVPPLPTSSSSRNTNDAIVHGGHVFVRGLFRRVWRRRYLELERQTGIVNYYEAPSLFTKEMQTYFFTSMDTPPPQAHRPKARMCILTAHLMKPTSSSTTSTSSSTTIHETTKKLKKYLLEITEEESLPANYGFTFRACDVDDYMEYYRAIGSPMRKSVPPDSRNYHCLVSTEEQAIEWVSYLHWSIQQSSTFFHSKNKSSVPLPITEITTTTTTTPTTTTDTNTDTDIMTMMIMSTNKTQEQEEEEPNVNESSLQPQVSTTFSLPPPPQQTIVITKVASFYLQYITKKMNNNNDLSYLWDNVIFFPSHHWILTFQIHLLLVPSTLYTNNLPTTTTTTTNENVTVQQVCLDKTFADVLELLESLLFTTSHDEDQSVQEILVQSQAHVKMLLEFQLSTKQQTLSTYQTQILEPMDTILRQLSTNPQICNSHQMRSFLQLKQTSTTNNTTIQHTILPTSTNTIHDIVKSFLSSSSSPPNNDKLKYQLYYIQYAHPLQFALLVIYYSMDKSKFNILCRIDLLLFLSLAIFIMGYHYGTTQQLKQQQQQIQQKEEEEEEEREIMNNCKNETSEETQTIPINEQNDSYIHDGDIYNESLQEQQTVTKQEVTLKLDSEEEAENEPISDENRILSQSSLGSENTPNEKKIIKTKKITKRKANTLSSPLPLYPANRGQSCYSHPFPPLFKVRGPTYLVDKIKIPSVDPVFPCLGVDVWLNDTALPRVSHYDCIIGGLLQQHIQSPNKAVLVINFLLPFGNLVCCFDIPAKELKEWELWQLFWDSPIEEKKERLKMLPLVVEGPWMVRKVVGPGTAPAVLGRVMPLEFVHEENSNVYEINIDISSSRIARGILNVVKGHVRVVSLAFAFIIEGITAKHLPERVMASFGIHSLNLEHCPTFPTPLQEKQPQDEQ